jgi:hypothetical protein
MASFLSSGTDLESLEDLEHVKLRGEVGGLIDTGDIDEEALFAQYFGSGEEEQVRIAADLCEACGVKFEEYKNELSCRSCGVTVRYFDVMGGDRKKTVIDAVGLKAAKYRSSIHKDSNPPRDETKKTNLLNVLKFRNREAPNMQLPDNILRDAADMYCTLTSGEEKNITYRGECAKQLMSAVLHNTCAQRKIYKSQKAFGIFMSTSNPSISQGYVILHALAPGRVTLAPINQVELQVSVAFTSLEIFDNDHWATDMPQIIKIVEMMIRENVCMSCELWTKVTGTIKYYNHHLKTLRVESGRTIDNSYLQTKLNGITPSTFDNVYLALGTMPKRVSRALRQ